MNFDTSFWANTVCKNLSKVRQITWGYVIIRFASKFPQKSPKVKAKKGWKRLEVDTATDEVVEDIAEHDPTKTYLSVHWSGDSDMEDTRIWMHTSITDKRVNGGLKTTGDLQVFNAFELVRFTIG